VTSGGGHTAIGPPMASTADPKNPSSMPRSFCANCFDPMGLRPQCSKRGAVQPPELYGLEHPHRIPKGKGVRQTGVATNVQSVITTQQRVDVLGRDGTAEIPALSGVTADAEQAPGLRGGLDADCGDVKGHGVRKLHQSRDDLEVDGIFPLDRADPCTAPKRATLSVRGFRVSSGGSSVFVDHAAKDATAANRCVKRDGDGGVVVGWALLETARWVSMA
jgi:hypothetical protein